MTPEILTHNPDWPSSLTRLDALRSTDPGLYAVALHAFIEGEAGRALESTRDMNFRTDHAGLVARPPRSPSPPPCRRKKSPTSFRS